MKRHLLAVCISDGLIRQYNAVLTLYVDILQQTMVNKLCARDSRGNSKYTKGIKNQSKQIILKEVSLDTLQFSIYIINYNIAIVINVAGFTNIT